MVILEWDGGGTRVADVSQPAHDRSRRFVRSKQDTGCPNFLNQFGSDHVLGALPGRNAIGSGKLHARGVRVVSYSMSTSLTYLFHQLLLVLVHAPDVRCCLFVFMGATNSAFDPTTNGLHACGTRDDTLSSSVESLLS